MESETRIAVPETMDLDTRSNEVLSQAKGIVVTTVEEESAAAAFLRGVKELQVAITKRFEDAKKQSHALHRSICDMEAEHTKPLREAEGIVKKHITSFRMMIEQKRIKEQERQNKLAEKRNERAESRGDEPVHLAPVIEAPALPEGASFTVRWHAKVFDLKALAAAVVQGTAAPESILPNQKYLDQLARALKAEMKLSGVEAVSETGMVQRL